MGLDSYFLQKWGRLIYLHIYYLTELNFRQRNENDWALQKTDKLCLQKLLSIAF